jgi:predicted ABC-type sugar transport system permease subunit
LDFQKKLSRLIHSLLRYGLFEPSFQQNIKAQVTIVAFLGFSDAKYVLTGLLELCVFHIVAISATKAMDSCNKPRRAQISRLPFSIFEHATVRTIETRLRCGHLFRCGGNLEFFMI